MAYAPKVVDGVVLRPGEAAALSAEERLARAVDVTTAEHFIGAGFDVNFVGPEEEIASSRARGGVEGAAGEGESGDAEGGEGVGEATGGPGFGVDDTEAAEAADESLYVDEETFCLWLPNQVSFFHSHKFQ